MTRRKGLALAAAVIGALSLMLAGNVAQVRTALAATGVIQIASRERTYAGRREGEVVVGPDVVLRVRTPAGGLTAPQRAARVAERLQGLLQNPQNVKAEDFRVGVQNGEYVVLLNNNLVVTADTYHAALNRVTPQRLAGIWRDNLATAVTTQVAGYRDEQERTSSKIVPIVSIGSGVRVGAAQITGAQSSVRAASLVGQIETTFQDVVRIRIWVPLESITRIDRVPAVSVNAYGDIRL